MNKKGGNAWILCPSKSFPGKLYYFNVVTGEAAWCLTEEEKRALDKDAAVRRLSDRGHSYPEPNTPPTEDEIDNSNVCYNFSTSPNIQANCLLDPPQVFGQPVFTKYISNHSVPGYVIPKRRMFVTNNPEPKKRSFDQTVQFNNIQEKCIQGYTMPLSKRFSTYRQVNFGTKTVNKGICTLPQNEFGILTPSNINWCNTSYNMNSGMVPGTIFGPKLNNQNKINVCTRQQNLFDSNMNNAIKKNNSKLIKDPVLTVINKREYNKVYEFMTNGYQAADAIQRSRVIPQTDTETEDTANSFLNSETTQGLRKAAFNARSSSLTKDNWIQNITFAINPKEPIQKNILDNDIVSSIKETNGIDDDTNINLNKTDLRLVLQARRRKPKVDIITSGLARDMFSTTSHFNNDASKIKGKQKQVTFDLESLREVGKEETLIPGESGVLTLHSENILEAQTSGSEVVDISYLRMLAKPFLKTDPWYVVVNTGVLLGDFELIENFVKKDVTCRLLVPYSVRSCIEAMSVGECGGRSWVVQARRVMRWLATTNKCVVLQPPITEKSSTSTIDGIISCCLQVLECNHAVLVTTDTELYSTGISLGIYTYKLEDIKRGIENETRISFDTSKNTKVNDNIFMQDINSFETFPLSKNFPDHSDVFKVPTLPKINRRKLLQSNAYDINNCTINEDLCTVAGTTLKDIKIKQSVNLNRSVNSKIEDDIKLLSLHDDTAESLKVTDNSISIPNRYPNFSIRKVIDNTNVQNNDNKDGLNQENVKFEHQRRVFANNILNSHVDLGNGPAEGTNTNGFGVKAKPLFGDAAEKIRNANSSVKEKHVLNINSYTVEDKLKKFKVDDWAVKQRIENRLDEWICCFNQIMEECLSGVLMNNTRGTLSELPPPWTLLEAVLCVKEMYLNNTAVKTVANTFCTILSNLTDKNNKLRDNIKSAEFMKMFGCGQLLVEALKNLSPTSEQASETEKLLNELSHHIQDPSTDIELPYAPIRVVKSEMEDAECLKRSIVSKKPAEIIKYLKTHFPAWKDIDENVPLEFTKSKDIHQQKTIVRTFGKNLNTIRITNKKKITFNDTPQRNAPEFKENVDIGVRELPKLRRKVDLTQKDIGKANTKDKSQLNNYKNTVASCKGRNDPKDNKHKDLIEDELDYEEFSLNDNKFTEDAMIEFDDNATPFIDGDVEKNNGGNDEENSFIDEIGDRTAQEENVNGHCGDSMNDSGFLNESLDACSFMRLFLAELSASFKLIYSFIEDSIREFRCAVLQQQDKKVLYDKANETHLYVADIIGKLRRIVDREASANTKLKSLVINAGVEALTDKRMTRYRQVTMKCLEQAQLLEGALKTMLALTNEHCDITAVDIDNVNGHVPYFNIFE